MVGAELFTDRTMGNLVSEDDIARARSDPAFRQQFLAQNLDRLLEALEMMRHTGNQDADTARLIKEGADLALKLADRLQRCGGPSSQGA
jgi:hypothetical protein